MKPPFAMPSRGSFSILTLVLLNMLGPSLLLAVDAKRQAATTVLDATSVKNLRIETVEVEESTFQETVFALGRIEVLPGKKAIVSSRIPGRAFSVLALPDQEVDEGEELMWVESRQPGDPPPTVMLPAPMAGTIAKVDIAVGKPIEPADALIEIVDLSVVEASARVPEHLAERLKKGLKAHIRIPAFPNQKFEAEIAHIGAYADEKSNTVEAAFHVQNPEKLLRPGMRAEFDIVVAERQDVVAIPRAALLGEAANRYVFVKDFDVPNAFVKTPVVTGQQNAGLVEIVSGLFPADEVVVRGAYSLSFAGGGTVSLKEALDAAHGHEHNEDGSEMTPEQKAAKEKAGGGDGHDHYHDHGHAHGEEGGGLLWKIATGVLALIVVAQMFLNRRSPESRETPATSIKKA